MVAMGERDAGVGGAGERGGDAGYDFELDAVRAQHFQFLAAAAEHERIAALQPHHALAGARVLEHQRVDLLLRGVVVAAACLPTSMRSASRRASAALRR